MRLEQQLREDAEKAACYLGQNRQQNEPQQGPCQTERDPAYQGGGLAGMSSPHQLIEDRINYHMAQVRELNALINALPRELPYVAANALTQLLLHARPRY